MKFTKKIVDLINKNLGKYHTLTIDEIEQGSVEIRVAGRFDWETPKIKKIWRDRLGFLHITCHYESDDYNYQNGKYENADSRFANALKV